MDELFKKFGLPAPADDAYGRGRDWNVDLIPKVSVFIIMLENYFHLTQINAVFSVHYG